MTPARMETLRQISFFSELSDYDLSQIAGITGEKSYGRGELIIEERTAAERFFIIVRGKIEISKRFEDGEEFVLAVHSDGEFFGEMALFERIVRSATVRAVGPARVLTIDKATLLRRIQEDPGLAFRMLESLCRRVRTERTTVPTELS